LDAVKESIAQGDKISFAGFGSFEAAAREARSFKLALISKGLILTSQGQGNSKVKFQYCPLI